MQMIAEVYGIMRDGLGMSPAEMADVFAGWNEGPLKSYLIEITAEVLDAVDPKTGKPLVEVILDKRRPEGHRPLVGDRGAGPRRAGDGHRGGGRRPRPLLAQGRARRRRGAVRRRDAKARRRPRQPRQRDHRLEEALLAGKIVAYAQGFAVMAKASEEFGWDLPLAPSPGSGGPAASSARPSSTTSPPPTRRGAGTPT